MAQEGEITFQFGDGKPTEHVRYSLQDGDEQVLRVFLSKARLLQDAMARNDDFQASYGGSWKVDQPVVISGTEPSDDQRAILLHRMRPFVHNDDITYFHTVRGIVARSSDAPFLREYLRATKDRFTGKMFQQQVVIRVNGLVLNSEETLTKWLYGDEYHPKEANMEALASAHGTVPVESSRPLFMMLLRCKADAVLLLAHVVHKMVGEPESHMAA